MKEWLGLTIGNSRLSWGRFRGDSLVASGNCQHLATAADRTKLIGQISFSFANEELLPIYLASVVPQQTKLWLDYPRLRLVTLQDVVVKNLYPTLGIDRALAIYGAAETYGYPCLVIDGGTALTFTGVDTELSLVGGAILPGLRSQLTFLRQKTAALPQIEAPPSVARRWALDTEEAIASGVIHTIVAGVRDFISDWQLQFPQSKNILTGGDSNLLWQYLHQADMAIDNKLILDRHLVLQALKLIHQRTQLRQLP